ncbi:MAG TPA: hypothetical protein VGS22_10285 [Thermoanaerobaculia bacterium]|jgi:hypothetical protein|nr:hypothetical protein [Thermoanaerobaculia bacterium]
MDVKVIFTGICAFVENQDKSKRCKMVALLPDGDPDREELESEVPESDVSETDVPENDAPEYGEEGFDCCGRYQVGEALDGEPLFRHRAFLKFKVKDLSGTAGLSGTKYLEAIRYLEAERVTFLPSDNGTDFNHKLTGLADLARIVPNYAVPDPDHFSDYPENLAAQILFDHGTLLTCQPKYEWSFPNTISKEVVTGPLSHEVVLHLPELTSLGVRISRFDGAYETLNFDSAGTVEILIANLCDENPLLWKTKDSKPKVDDDFRWHYQLLANGDDLREELYSLPLPIPHPADGGSNGQGMNCLGSRLAAVEYDLDAYLPKKKA